MTLANEDTAKNLKEPSDVYQKGPNVTWALPALVLFRDITAWQWIKKIEQVPKILCLNTSIVVVLEFGTYTKH